MDGAVDKSYPEMSGHYAIFTCGCIRPHLPSEMSGELSQSYLLKVEKQQVSRYEKRDNSWELPTDLSECIGS